MGGVLGMGIGKFLAASIGCSLDNSVDPRTIMVVPANPSNIRTRGKRTGIYLRATTSAQRKNGSDPQSAHLKSGSSPKSVIGVKGL